MEDVDNKGRAEGEEDRPHADAGHGPHHEHGSHHHGHGPHQHGHGSHHHEKPMEPEEAVRSLLVLGQVALDADDYESAVEAYSSALQIEQDETALYNLGSLYARGLGVRRDYVKAARMFHQAELMGNERAGKLCAKCMYDYVYGTFLDKTPAGLYARMAVFVSMVYPEATEQRREVNSGLFVIASTLYNKGEHAEAARVFRAAAEFGDDGYAQYYLALLYDAGTGLPKNDLVALYWLDRAVDNGASDVALEARDGMLDAYRQGRMATEFGDAMATLSSWCETGTPDVPEDADKIARWREMV